MTDPECLKLLQETNEAVLANGYLPKKNAEVIDYAIKILQVRIIGKDCGSRRRTAEELRELRRPKI